MATPVLPDELWILVLDTVSQRTLRAFMQVNRVFYQAGRGVYLNRKLLNLAPTTDVIDTRLELVRDRLARTREHTATLSSIKVLRITPHLYKPPIRQFTPTRPGWRVIQSPTVLPPISLASQAENLTSQICLLIPTLTGVHSLEVFAEHLGYGDISPTLTLAWSEFGSRLTSLSIQIMDREGLHRYLPRTHSFALPALTSFRLRVSTSEFVSNYRSIHNLLKNSQFLENLEYHLVGLIWAGHNGGNLDPDCPAVHYNLRVLKWTTERGAEKSLTPTPISFLQLFQLVSSPLEVLYLNPAPSQSLCESMDFTTVSELHIDLCCCDNPATLFTGLSEGGAIKVLELTGYSSLKPQHLFLLLQKMDNLATLYLPMSTSTFSLNALAVLAEKVPELQKLVLTLDDPYLLLSRRLERIMAALKSQTPVSKYAVLGRWKLQDFGILSSGVHPRGFEKVLNALVRVIPSISSFYGSGLQRVPSVIQEDWAGDL